ncbi:hypothetical protein COLO4_05568 [Corchorus olitorius]|uniref:Uncharacterized protein n=1 Tax=Corchorus olitorius TaxID=93759 RepID=A0A1R3KQI9_9ROSI|nr:hypothetical protein COLO4_05568 [Corchorus olitorius]
MFEFVKEGGLGLRESLVEGCVQERSHLRESGIQNLDGSSPPAAAVPPMNPDFLFGLDKVNLSDSVPPPVTNEACFEGRDGGIGGPPRDRRSRCVSV